LLFKFYYVDGKGTGHLVGVLPGRRRHPEGITGQTGMNWWRKIVGNIPMQKGHRLRFEQLEVNGTARDEEGYND
jgi:hypothetical protein